MTQIQAPVFMRPALPGDHAWKDDAGNESSTHFE
jgi:hypothetical protein